jgi:hypothetical protein
MSREDEVKVADLADLDEFTALRWPRPADHQHDGNRHEASRPATPADPDAST